MSALETMLALAIDELIDDIIEFRPDVWTSLTKIRQVLQKITARAEDGAVGR